MDLDESAKKIREAAEREAASDRRGGKDGKARGEADSAAAEVLPEVTSHKHAKGKPPRR
jgi:hypothetical protein